eukprot:TRINITY_DN12523_c0_g1_i1.p1 TRINITY_DN12523_c0_g1~~TRINITY_DN12523_c0_g1_i1.p1  ORF type:complete len:193 (-),score=30.67 TRINITY_DN12523_c0_g1_i1:53-631(-)
MSSSYDSYKIVVVGTGGVGKSCLTIQFVKRVWVDKYDPTIEDSYDKVLDIDDKPCKIEILDTAGTEQFTSLSGVFMKSGDGFLLVYSIIAHSTIDALPDLKTQIRRVKDDDTVPMIVVGNKCDLDAQRVIQTEEGQKLANEFGVPFFEASAKKLINVDEVFTSLVRIIRGQRQSAPESKDQEEKKRFRCVLL